MSKPGILERILPIMRCTLCGEAAMTAQPGCAACSKCGARFPIREGILDMLEGSSVASPTPFQRIMQAPLVVSVYERVWRQVGYYLASSRPFASELRTVLEFERRKSLGRVLDLACGT